MHTFIETSGFDFIDKASYAAYFFSTEALRIMLKSELTARLAARFPQLAIRNLHASVNHIIEVMRETLIAHQRIEIRGFGSFNIKRRRPHRAHNPKTRQALITTDQFVPHFKPGKELREGVNASHKVSEQESI